MSVTDSNSLATIPVPGSSASILATEIDGKAFVALRPLCDALGIDAKNQRAKLQSKDWAVGVISTSTGTDGKSYDMYLIDRRTMTMWLATIDENRVNEAARETVRVFQREAADALDAYFHDGGAINPSASVDQLDILIGRSKSQMEILRLAQGIVDPKHLEAKGRIVLARALGEAPELNPADVPLYVQDFMRSKGLPATLVKAKCSGFGTRLKGAYIEKHGVEPSKYMQEMPNGSTRPANAYTEADRDLFERVWAKHYAMAVSA